MKKLLIAMFVLCVGFSTIVGAEEYNAMDLGIWFGVPSSTETANVRGLRLGLPISSGQGSVDGIEFALFCAATDDIKGLQMSCIAITDSLAGAQVSLVNICDDKAAGAQVGIVNVAGKRGWQIGLVNSSNNAKFQFGIINMNKGGLWPFSFIINFGKGTFACAEANACNNKCTAKVKPCAKCTTKK